MAPATNTDGGIEFKQQLTHETGELVPRVISTQTWNKKWRYIGSNWKSQQIIEHLEGPANMAYIHMMLFIYLFIHSFVTTSLIICK